MSTLAEIHERVASAMSRISRRLGRWFWRRVVDAFNAFKSLIIFVPLIYLIGFGIELQYSTGWLIASLGWIMITGGVCLSVWAIIAARINEATADSTEAKFMWMICSILILITVSILVSVSYEFKSPILSVTNKLPSIVLDTFRKTAGGGGTASQAHLVYDKWPSIKTRASAARNRVKINIWVEALHATSKATILKVACKTWDDYTDVILIKPPRDDVYIIDENGKKYILLKDLGEYDYWGNKRTIVGSEIYRWQLVFAPIPVGTALLKCKHPHFYDVEIQLAWEPQSLP
jgi:hypothetical protein